MLQNAKNKLRAIYGDPDILLKMLCDLLFVIFAALAGAAIERGIGWAAGFWIALAIAHIGHTFKR